MKPGRRWRLHGERPGGLCDRRFEWAYLFGGAIPATGGEFALVLPEVSTLAMQAFLDRFATALAENAHVARVLDRAGRHGARALVVPANVTLVSLPPYGPELNPVERVWLFLRERLLFSSSAKLGGMPAAPARRYSRGDHDESGFARFAHGVFGRDARGGPFSGLG